MTACRRLTGTRPAGGLTFSITLAPRLNFHVLEVGFAEGILSPRGPGGEGPAQGFPPLPRQRGDRSPGRTQHGGARSGRPRARRCGRVAWVVLGTLHPGQLLL